MEKKIKINNPSIKSSVFTSKDLNTKVGKSGKMVVLVCIL